MDKFILCYCSLIGSDGNPYIADCDNNGSLCTLAPTQTSKTRYAKIL